MHSALHGTQVDHISESEGEMSNRLELLKKVREQLSDPKCWTRHAIARDKDDRALEFGDDPRAVCWCLVGAFEKVGGHIHSFSSMLAYLREGVGTLGPWNDTHSHAEVLALLDRKIMNLELELGRDT